MQRCINLGEKALGKTYPNPNVGCLLFYDGKIISEGYTSQAGQNHAEVNVINKINDSDILRKSTLYVTLEPCSHHGKTPPCCNAIFNKNIKRVVVGCKDPNELVNGSGIKYLNKKGVKVKVGVLENECRELHKRFFTYQNKKRPYIILKWAETSDGFISPLKNNTGRPFWISNKYTRQIVHKWRSQENAILVGSKTYITDNPILDSRNWNNNNPQGFIIAGNNKIQSKRFDIIRHDKTLSVDNINQILFEKNIQSILVEGGKKTLETFIKSGCWDEARIIKNEKKINNGIRSPILNSKINNVHKVDDDLIQTYFNQ